MNAVENFLASYFHQDWTIDSEDYRGVVDIYTREKWKSEEVAKVVMGLRELAETARIEDYSLEMLIKQFHCYYDPSFDGLSISDWLNAVADLIDVRFKPN